MAIKDKTRKKLWSKSGNMCCICKEKLFQESSIEKGEVFIGEECHICGKAEESARYNVNVHKNAVNFFFDIKLFIIQLLKK